MSMESKHLIGQIDQQQKEINVKLFKLLTIGIGLLTIVILSLILSIQNMSVIGICLSSIGIYICGKTLIKIILGYIQARQVLKIMKQSILQVDKQ